MKFRVYWNPLHPGVGMKDALRTLGLYYAMLTVGVAVVGGDVTALMFTGAVSVSAAAVGVVKAWQRRFSPVAPLGNPFGPDDVQE